jgi:hypothetical protein
MTLTPATDKQMAYLRKLVASTDTPDIHDYLVSRGVCETNIGGTFAKVPSKIMASRLIDELKSGARRAVTVRDPGEDMADRWAESHCCEQFRSDIQTDSRPPCRVSARMDASTGWYDRGYRTGRMVQPAPGADVLQLLMYEDREALLDFVLGVIDGAELNGARDRF